MNSKQKNPDHQQQWPETQWSIVINAGGTSEEKRVAIEKLLEAYWPALKAHLVVRKRLNHSDAEDFLQDFFVRKIVEQNIIERADYSRGKFRSFLLKALENFLRDYFRSTTYRNRPVQVPEQEPDEDVAEPNTDVFDKAWAIRVFYQANELFQQFCSQNNREQQWNVYRERVLRPVFLGEEPQSYEEVAERLDGITASQARNLLSKAKNNFTKSLRVVISDYVEDDSVVDEEIAQLLSVLKKADNLDEAVAPFLEQNPFFESNEKSHLRSQHASLIFQEEPESDPVDLKRVWNEILDSAVIDVLRDDEAVDANFQVDATFRDLLFAPKPDIDTIDCLRRFAKQKHAAVDDGSKPCYFVLYLLCIAVGLYKCKRRLSQLAPEQLTQNFEIAQGYNWIDAHTQEYLSLARKMA